MIHQYTGLRHLIVFMLLVFNFGATAQIPSLSETNNLVREYIAAGDNKMKIGDFNGAIADYTTAINSNASGFGEALVKRAIALNLQGRSKEAKDDLDKARLLGKPYTDLYDSLTTSKLRKDSLSTLNNPYQNINIKSIPADTSTFLDLGAAGMGMENYTDAIGYFKAYLKKYPGDTTAILYTAIAYTQTEKYDSALVYIKKSLTGKTELAYNNYGLYLYKQGFYIDAIDYFNKAVKANPLFSIAYFNRAVSKKRMGNQRGYEDDIDNAINATTSVASIYFNRAYYERVNGGESVANGFFNKAAALNKAFDRSYLRTLPGKKFLTEYELLHDEFKAKNTKDAEALFSEGVFAVLFGDYTLGIVDFNKASTLNPQNADYVFLRGVARIVKTDDNLGCRDIKKAIELGVDRDAKPVQDNFCK